MSPKSYINVTFKTVDEIDSGGGQSFSSWLKVKLGIDSELARTVATIASTFAILEIAVNLICHDRPFGRISLDNLH